jgi:hypothetical protein
MGMVDRPIDGARLELLASSQRVGTEGAGSLEKAAPREAFGYSGRCFLARDTSVLDRYLDLERFVRGFSYSGVMKESEGACRKREWAAREREVETMRGGLLQGVDPEIKPVVVALRAHGLPTSGSCAGHLDRRSAFPYVGFRPVPMGPAFEPVIAVPSYVNHLIGCLDELLADFYRDKRPPANVRLNALTPAKRWVVLRSAGAMEDEARDPNAKKEFLLRSRQEMLRFAEYLQQRFFQEGPIMKRRRGVDALRLLQE